MTISSNFDGGNINCLDICNTGKIKLEIKKDNNSDFFQWFYFKLTGAKSIACSLEIQNASKTSYANAWHGYKALASYDRQTWFRVDTFYDGEKLLISHEPLHDIVYYAYFTPYSMQKHDDLIAKAQIHPRVEYINLGSSLDGFDMDLLKIGEHSKNKKVCWLIARQHPGETMAQWCMEGILESLLDEQNALVRELLTKVVFYIVPNMNPDGSFRGNLRTNAAGANLNREWLNPSMEKSPEVFLVKEKMKLVGMDFCLDIHGDEELAYNFIAGAQGIVSWNNKKQEQLDTFQEALQKNNPDFQTEIGYDIDKHGKALMTVGTNYLAFTFNALAMTLEMPFKDTIKTPNKEFGWSAKRSSDLGKSCLQALVETLDKL